MSGFVGKITAAGYEPPLGTLVRWTRHGGNERVCALRSMMTWDGGNMSTAGFWGRYAGGMGKEVEGMYIIGVGDKLEGGEAFSILHSLYLERGVNRIPTRQEYWDFAIANGNGRVLTAEDWPRLTGRPSPIQQPPGKKPVDPPPPQPVTPPVLPPAAGLAPLSPASRRVEELRYSLGQWVNESGMVLAGTGAPDLVKRLAGAVLMLIGLLVGPAQWPHSKPFAGEALRMWRLLRRRAGDMRELPKEDR